jgi:hypothetical protein
MTSCPRFQSNTWTMVVPVCAVSLLLTFAFNRNAASEPSVAGKSTVPKAHGMDLVQRRCSDEEQNYCKIWSAECSGPINTYSMRESCKRKYDGCMRYGCAWSGPGF